MNTYFVFLDGIYFNRQTGSSEEEVIQSTKKQLEQLWPINMSAESIEAYRDRFRNKTITVKKAY